jgi:hypothetical protein
VTKKEKSFITTTPGTNDIKLFTVILFFFPNKLQRFVPGKPLQLCAECLQVLREPTQVETLKGAPLQVRLLALPINNRLG